MKLIESKFTLDQDDYEEGTLLLQEYEYRGYFIREFKQEPCDRWAKTMYSENEYDFLMGDEKGETGYEILNHKGEIIEEDFYCMGDTATCNAEKEIDYLIQENTEKI
jgi:hypothetical protein